MIRHTQQFIVITSLLLSTAVWAQSNTDLPALPADMSAPPAVELPPPPPALAPSEAIQDTPTFQPAPTAVPAQPTPVVEPADATATEVFEPAPGSVQPPAETVATTGAKAPEGISVAVPAGAELKKDFKPSYGDFEQSLLYSPEDIDRMKKVLYMYERVKRPEGAIAPVQDEFAKLIDAPVDAMPIDEPQQYPSYYLSSIVYRSSRDWLFWMNGKKYSPKKMPENMEMVSISPRAVTMIWNPSYVGSAHMRYEQKQYDQTIPKHLRSRMSQVRWSEEGGHFLFTLSPNQTFVSAALGVYEGKFADRSVPAITQTVGEVFAEPGPPPEAIDPNANMKATIDQLQKVNRNLSQLAPRTAIAQPAPEPADAPAGTMPPPVSPVVVQP